MIKLETGKNKGGGDISQSQPRREVPDKTTHMRHWLDNLSRLTKQTETAIPRVISLHKVN
jgi:hypothetical protein